MFPSGFALGEHDSPRREQIFMSPSHKGNTCIISAFETRIRLNLQRSHAVILNARAYRVRATCNIYILNRLVYHALDRMSSSTIIFIPVNGPRSLCGQTHYRGIYQHPTALDQIRGHVTACSNPVRIDTVQTCGRKSSNANLYHVGLFQYNAM